MQAAALYLMQYDQQYRKHHRDKQPNGEISECKSMYDIGAGCDIQNDGCRHKNGIRRDGKDQRQPYPYLLYISFSTHNDIS
jgi:hypothetical protein